MAAGKSVVHRLAFALIENSRVSTVAASHGPIVFVLSQTIGKTVANKNRLQVNVAVLMCHNLRRENWNVVARIGFACDMEVLLRILWKLLEKEGEKSVDVLSSSNSVANRVSTVREPNIDGLVEEDN